MVDLIQDQEEIENHMADVLVVVSEQRHGLDGKPREASSLCQVASS